MDPGPTAVSEYPFFAEFSPEMQAITLALREVARQEMHGAQETVFTQSFNYSPDGLYQHRICYLWPGKSHATLGFFYGTSLDDPDELLEGTGKRMRHVKVRNADEAMSPAIRALVRQAWEIAPVCLSSRSK